MEVYSYIVLFSALLQICSAQTMDAPSTTVAQGQATGILDMGTVSNPTGVVTSPGYPHKYPAGVDRTVSIALPLHSTIEVYFDELDTQECYDCNCDFVEMSFFGRHCGSKLPHKFITIYTNSRYFEVRFRSDDSEEHKGFSLRYVIYPTTSPMPTTVPTTPTCPYTPCHSACPPESQSNTTDFRGCDVCHCHWPSSTTVNYPTATYEPMVGNSLLLHVLLNLRSQAQAMERQAQSLQEIAEMGVALTHLNDKEIWSE